MFNKAFAMASLQAYVAVADVYIGEVTSDVRDTSGVVTLSAPNDGWTANAAIPVPKEAKDITAAGTKSPAEVEAYNTAVASATATEGLRAPINVPVLGTFTGGCLEAGGLKISASHTTYTTTTSGTDIINQGAADI